MYRSWDCVKKYKSDPTARLVVRRCLNLAFFPEQCVVTTFKDIINFAITSGLNIMFQKFFFSKFQLTYFGEFDSCGFCIKPPVFDVRFWSVFTRIKKQVPRTTNCVESWHKSLNNRTEIAHPNLGKFLSLIQKEEELVRFGLSRAKSGNIEFSRRNYEKEEKLRVVADNYDLFENYGFFYCSG